MAVFFQVKKPMKFQELSCITALALNDFIESEAKRKTISIYIIFKIIKMDNIGAQKSNFILQTVSLIKIKQ